MIRTLCFTLLLLSCLQMKAQINLVPNPSFEEYNNCPKDVGAISRDTNYFPVLKNWINPISIGTSDYFNACAKIRPFSDYVGVPYNGTMGNCPAKSGEAYAGILVMADYQGYPYSTTYREYISIKLNQALLPNTIYHVAFYARLSYRLDNNIFSISKLGCAFTEYLNQADSNLFHLTPQVLNDSTRFLNDTTWMLVQGRFKAKGGERYLTIGNFFPTVLTKYEATRGNSSLLLSYYAIDDVSVIAFDKIGRVIDTTICYGNSVVLSKRSDADSCIWNDKSKETNHIFSQSGTYWVTNWYKNLLSITDTFVVHVLNPQTTTTNISLCEGSSIVLKPSPAQTYKWSNGSRDSILEINAGGLYTVQKNNTHCIGVDSFLVLEKPLPIITSLNDTVVCFEDVRQLLLDAGVFKSYLWKPTGETSRYIFSSKAQPYLLTVTDSNNCSAYKRFEVLETCPDFLFVPNAFTPNGDGINDVFLPQTRSLQSYEMIIVNRWGQTVFTTKETTQGWDGSSAPADVYVVHITYQPKGKAAQSKSQNLTLLR